MIYHAVETAYTLLVANFDTDLAALGLAAGVTVDATASFGKRLAIEDMLQLDKPLPLVSVTALTATTQTTAQGHRDAHVMLAFDYYASGADADLLAAQVELGAEALLRTLDRLWPTIAGGAGCVEDSVAIELSRASDPLDEKLFVRRATMTFTAQDRDTGL
jgi:hypothetical protein